MEKFRQRVHEVLEAKFENNTTLHKIKNRVPVTPTDLTHLQQMVLDVDPELNLDVLLDDEARFKGHLDDLIRSILGVDKEVVEGAFAGFFKKYPQLTAQQIRFLRMLKTFIAKHGSVTMDALYDDPFTQIHHESVDGLFEEEDTIGELIDIIEQFSPGRLAAEGTK